jgi:hypothetical protein
MGSILIIVKISFRFRADLLLVTLYHTLRDEIKTNSKVAAGFDRIFSKPLAFFLQIRYTKDNDL